MKALMFGWEFPPHILGGLGTASYGLTQGMAQQEDMEITFVIPRPKGDEDKSFLKIIGAGDTPIVYKDLDYDFLKERLGSCLSPEEYYKLREHIYEDFRYMHTNDIGAIEFSGRYPENLLEEINNYSIVAGVIARSEGFDVIHSHDWLTYPAGIHAKRITGKPLVVHVHATDFDRSRGNVNPNVFAIEMDGMNNADHIITVSDLTRRTVIEKYHQDPAKVTTVHNAVIPLSDEILSIPNKSNIKESIVTFLGRITMQKGCEYFVEAAALVLSRTKNIRFIMAGNGDMMEAMIDLVVKYNIADHFHFTGFMKGKEVYEVFKASDVYVMPSVSEPFGISPLEAMQCGVPSIISKQSGCAEILDHAVKLDYWDVEGMANAIYALTQYKDYHQFIKEEGIKEVAGITWYNAGLKVRSIYERVLNQR